MPTGQKKYRQLDNLRPESDFIDNKEYQEKAQLKNLHSNFLADSLTGVVAGGNIVALYTGVEIAKTFLSGLAAQIVFPLFILLDILDIRNSWSNFFKLRKLKGGEWKGTRNAFARAILTSAVVPLSIFVIVASFIPGFIPGIAIALSFTAIMASRSIFNIGSGIFNLGRSKVPENPMKAVHKEQSVIQLGVGVSNIFSLGATVSVFLLGGLGLATFGFAPLGIAAGIMLGGILAYAAYKSYQNRKETSSQMKEMRQIQPEESRVHIDETNKNTLRPQATSKKRPSSLANLSTEVDTSPSRKRPSQMAETDTLARKKADKLRQSGSHDLMPNLNDESQTQERTKVTDNPSTTFAQKKRSSTLGAGEQLVHRSTHT